MVSTGGFKVAKGQQKSSGPSKNNLTDHKQAVYFTVVTVNYVQIMRCSCDWTTRCFNVISKHVNAKYKIIQQQHKSR